MLREIEHPHVSPRPALPRAMTTSLLVDGSAPERCARRRANSETPPPPPLRSPSSIPEWRRESLGQEMVEALERIERDSPQPLEPTATRRPSNLGSRLFGGGSRARASSGTSKDRRKAEKRREKEGCSEISTISAPFEVTHSLYLQRPGPASAACG